MGSSRQLSGQFGNNTFLEVLEGIFPRVCLATDNRDDHKIIRPNFPQAVPPIPNTNPRRTDTSIKQPRTRKPDPAEILLNLLLPQEISQHFIGLLEPIGYKLCYGDVPTLGLPRRKFHYVKRENVPPQLENLRSLIYIPREILNKPSQGNLALINAIFSNFSDHKPGSFLIVFSKLDQIDILFRDLIEQRRMNRGLRGKFVPWMDIRQLATGNLTVEYKRALLERILDIDKL